MTLREWCDQEGNGVVTRLHRKTGVSRSWLHELRHDVRRLDSYKVASRVSEATGYAVSIRELCTWTVEPSEKAMERMGATT